MKDQQLILLYQDHEKLLIHQTHFHPRVGMIIDFLIAFINIFNFFFIKIQKTTFQNILDRRLRVCPLSKFRSKNHEIISTGNKNHLIIKIRNIYISCRKRHIVMCTWSTNKSRTQYKIWCIRHINNYKRQQIITSTWSTNRNRTQNIIWCKRHDNNCKRMSNRIQWRTWTLGSKRCKD